MVSCERLLTAYPGDELEQLAVMETLYGGALDAQKERKESALDMNMIASHTGAQSCYCSNLVTSSAEDLASIYQTWYITNDAGKDVKQEWPICYQLY